MSAIDAIYIPSVSCDALHESNDFHNSRIIMHHGFTNLQHFHGHCTKRHQHDSESHSYYHQHSQNVTHTFSSFPANLVVFSLSNILTESAKTTSQGEVERYLAMLKLNDANDDVSFFLLSFLQV
jgi:hypothetical protein